ncbi:twin-arginine translocation protein TatB [Nitrobacter hamburgensis X14]|uniref:Sec-independent protein translocase protein TatB n=1 Tax=Nitrobacter hamburgensis (strain DSM 10229 / NCIMB 13809 / X14) TaxID=323097 RepID=TATB_NITHX|nr:Sec-independent protein translocase protein TatB [Nitrobacter hamburgensis]Q1QME4.1 RecName: Full=Sec-independent protein translocase protein TatB [Nitrobacter hamburgensis X14]ABE62603.1 twin-arginine translocation protein TatB [Nitrobacter hamburgensis X14]
MFDIGWSELVVIAVVALIAIGPKELPGVLRMVGQWMGKARRMAAEFQGQFNEAMREADMAELKKSFDEVRDATSGLTSGNLMTKLTDSLGEPPKLEDLDKPAANRPAADMSAASANDVPASGSIAPEAAIPKTGTEADAKALASEPLAITPEFQHATPEPAPATHETPHEAVKDAKAS